MKVYINPYNGHKMVYLEGRWYYLLNGKLYHRVTIYEI